MGGGRAICHKAELRDDTLLMSDDLVSPSGCNDAVSYVFQYLFRSCSVEVPGRWILSRSNPPEAASAQARLLGSSEAAICIARRLGRTDRRVRIIRQSMLWLTSEVQQPGDMPRGTCFACCGAELL